VPELKEFQATSSHQHHYRNHFNFQPSAKELNHQTPEYFIKDPTQRVPDPVLPVTGIEFRRETRGHDDQQGDVNPEILLKLVPDSACDVLTNNQLAHSDPRRKTNHNTSKIPPRPIPRREKQFCFERQQ
jgi:hypothetical protein